jgi:drug/metabolite transporter (DMT)-like permease
MTSSWPEVGGVTRRTAVLTAVTMAAFASNSLLCRAALGGGLLDAASFTTLRLVSGALVLGLLARGRSGSASGGGSGSAVALFAYAIGFSLAYLRIPAGTGALLLFGAVQVTMLATGLWAGERPRPREGAGLLVSLAGLVALTRPGLAQPDPFGAALMLAAGVAWGIYSLRGRGATDALASNAVNFARALPLALLGSGAALLLSPPHVSPRGALLALASGALASGLGYALWYAAIRGLTATQAAIVQLSVPPLAAAGGVLLLGEALTLRLAVAGVAILGGIALAVSARPLAVSAPQPSNRSES